MNYHQFMWCKLRYQQQTFRILHEKFGLQVCTPKKVRYIEDKPQTCWIITTKAEQTGGHLQFAIFFITK